MYEIVIGRDEDDRKNYGIEGTILIGKHYVKMGNTTSLSNPIYLDVTRSHVVFVCGKRGSGKSYTMGVIAEGMAYLPEEISNNMAVVILDTMGVYWTMKYSNSKEESILKEWGLRGKELDVVIYTPHGYYKKFKEEGIPTDHPFSIKPNEIGPSEWCMILHIDADSPQGVLLERVITKMREDESYNYTIDEIIQVCNEESGVSDEVKMSIENRLLASKGWGLFHTDGTELDDLIKGGQVTILDVSCYVTEGGSSELRALVIGLLAQKLFIQRMIARKKEEYDTIHKSINYFEDGEKQKKPLVWLIIDEAHEFLPKEGETVATQPLVTILREGRQPGISLILASQQPGKIHSDVMTQSDIVISHRLTAKMDIDALGLLMQSYMREGLDKHINALPSSKGSGIIFDDINERIYPMRVRPRISWHGGSSPSAMPEKKDLFSI